MKQFYVDVLTGERGRGGGRGGGFQHYVHVARRGGGEKRGRAASEGGRRGGGVCIPWILQPGLHLCQVHFDGSNQLPPCLICFFELYRPSVQSALCELMNVPMQRLLRTSFSDNFDKSLTCIGMYVDREWLDHAICHTVDDATLHARSHCWMPRHDNPYTCIASLTMLNGFAAPCDLLLSGCAAKSVYLCGELRTVGSEGYPITDTHVSNDSNTCKQGQHSMVQGQGRLGGLGPRVPL